MSRGKIKLPRFSSIVSFRYEHQYQNFDSSREKLPPVVAILNFFRQSHLNQRFSVIPTPFLFKEVLTE